MSWMGTLEHMVGMLINLWYKRTTLFKQNLYEFYKRKRLLRSFKSNRTLQHTKLSKCV